MTNKLYIYIQSELASKMSWIWGSSGNKDKSNDESLSKLDPALREFLKKEKPVNYTPSTPSPPPASAKPVQTPTQPAVDIAAETASKPAVPPQSLFQDGRYAHLWKNYEPLSAIENRGKSDQEKLNEIIEVYNDRKAAIGRAALENCALEQMALNDCYKSGSWTAKMTLCRDEDRSLNRCYNMQAKFLKALGYLSLVGRPAEEEERIQMHADKLYHQMLEHERLVEEAKKEGRPAPEFDPMSSRTLTAAMSGRLSEKTTTPTTTPTSSVALDPNIPTPPTPGRDPDAIPKWNVSPELQQEFERRIEGLKGVERALEIKEIEAELEAGKLFGKQIHRAFEEERQNRLARKESGKETIGDTIKRLWGW